MAGKARGHPHVIMFSGCRDEQTSADVKDVVSFGLPTIEECGEGVGGGACTSSLIKAIRQNPDQNWAQLIEAMKVNLRYGYKQIPTLNLSHKSALIKDKFTPVNLNEAAGNKRRAVFIGINYKGSSCPLTGCHNDVHQIKELLEEKYRYDFAERGGADENKPGKVVCRTLLDKDGEAQPSMANIEEALRWLVAGAKAGDSLFLHYSGHGAQVQDDNGDEADGMDEVLVPADFKNTPTRLIRDDKLNEILVQPLEGSGVKLVCVMDCCHSGTVLDLGYRYKPGDEFGAFEDDLAMGLSLPGIGMQGGVITTSSHSETFQSPITVTHTSTSQVVGGSMSMAGAAQFGGGHSPGGGIGMQGGGAAYAASAYAQSGGLSPRSRQGKDTYLSAAWHEADQLRQELQESRAKLETQAMHYLEQLNESVRSREADRRTFESQLFVMNEQFTVMSSSAQVTTREFMIEETTSREVSFRESVDTACAQAVSVKLKEMTERHLAKISDKDKEITELRAQIEQKELEFATRETAMHAEMSMHKESANKLIKSTTTIKQQIQSAEKTGNADVRLQFEQREMNLRAVYWEQFRSLREELARATTMTRTVDARYKERVQAFAQSVQESIVGMWDDAMVHAHVEAGAEAMASVRVQSAESLQLMRQRFESEVDRRMTMIAPVVTTVKISASGGAAVAAATQSFTVTKSSTTSSSQQQSESFAASGGTAGMEAQAQAMLNR